jgi:hypothetical protein
VPKWGATAIIIKIVKRRRKPPNWEKVEHEEAIFFLISLIIIEFEFLRI